MKSQQRLMGNIIIIYSNHLTVLNGIGFFCLFAHFTFGGVHCYIAISKLGSSLAKRKRVKNSTSYFYLFYYRKDMEHALHHGAPKDSKDDGRYSGPKDIEMAYASPRRSTGASSQLSKPLLEDSGEA